MAARDADDQPLTATTIPVSRPPERVQAQLFAKQLRSDIETMKRKVTTAESAWQKRCAAEGYIEPPKRLVIVRERLAEARRMLTALNARFPRS